MSLVSIMDARGPPPLAVGSGSAHTVESVRCVDSEPGRYGCCRCYVIGWGQLPL